MEEKVPRDADPPRESTTRISRKGVLITNEERIARNKKNHVRGAKNGYRCDQYGTAWGGIAADTDEDEATTKDFHRLHAPPEELPWNEMSNDDEDTTEAPVPAERYKHVEGGVRAVIKRKRLAASALPREGRSVKEADTGERRRKAKLALAETKRLLKGNKESSSRQRRNRLKSQRERAAHADEQQEPAAFSASVDEAKVKAITRGKREREQEEEAMHRVDM